MPFINRFLVGCDPEFALVGQRPPRECDCGDPDCEGHAPGGFGPLNLDDVLEYEGEFGTDHGGYVVEVRPKPQRSTYRLTLNLRHILHEAQARKLPEARWRAGAYLDYEWPDGNVGLPLGGHVHLGVPYVYDDSDEVTLKRVKALDAVTRTVEDLDILPKQECEARRDESEYGYYGEVRPSADGRHLEYRTMASWLFHPTPTFLCLTGAKLACAQPQETLEILKGEAPATELRQFFETFAPRDGNALRIVEKIYQRNRKLVHNPDVDLRESWHTIPF